jgi:hypothetical protein
MPDIVQPPVIDKDRDINMQGRLVRAADSCDCGENPWDFQFTAGGCNVKDWMQAFSDIPDEIKQQTAGMGKVQGTLAWCWLLPFTYLGTAIFTAYNKLVCGWLKMLQGVDATIGQIAFSEFIMGIINILSFGGARKGRDILRRSNDYTLPVGMPSPAEAAGAWLGNTITDACFQSWVKSGDMRFEAYQCVARAQKFKFSALELKTLDKRHKLSRGSIDTRMRELGSIEGTDAAELEALFTQIPGPAELIRYMVRDTENPQVVTTFQTDKNFTENFQGQLKEWADMQGLSEDYMRREWRAHWSIPAPTQLYVMLHRLNHGEDPNQGANIQEDIKNALIQQDILPYWIDRLMAVSYHPLTRTDLFRAFERGWIDDDTFLSGMYHNGYSDDDADTLLRFAGEERRLAIRRSDFVSAYRDGDISLDQTSQWAQHEGYDPSVIPDVTSEATFVRGMREQKDQIKEIARRYRECLITEDQARQDAEDLGIPQDVTDYHLEIAGLNTRCGTAKIRASTLCQALEDGNITSDQYVDELRKNRYSDVEISVLVGMCQTKIRKDAVKRALAQQKAADAAAKAEANAEAKAIKEAERQRQRAIAEMTKLERGRQGRQKLLEGAVAYLAKNIPGDTTGFDMAVQQTYNAVMAKYGLTQNEAAQAVYFSAQAAASKDLATFAANADAIAAGGVAGQWVLSPSIPLV